MRGGGLPGISPRGGSPAAPFNERWGRSMAAFPPGNMVTPGIYNDAKFYGKLNKPFLPDPTNTHGSGVTKKGGKRKKKRNKKKRGKCSARKKRGGSISQLLANNVPLFSDVRDVYWKGGEIAHNKFNPWIGKSNVANTSAGDQPISHSDVVEIPSMSNVPVALNSGAIQAGKFTN